MHPYWTIYVHYCHMLRRNSKETVGTLITIIYTTMFHMNKLLQENVKKFSSSSSLRHCIRSPHRCLADSRTFRDHTNFPRLSRSWKFYKHNSRTFQEAWEPCKRHRAMSNTSTSVTVSDSCQCKTVSEKPKPLLIPSVAESLHI